MGVQTLPTGVFGGLPAETWGLLLGRSIMIVKGLQIYPGVTDNDYEGSKELGYTKITRPQRQLDS